MITNLIVKISVVYPYKQVACIIGSHVHCACCCQHCVHRGVCVGLDLQIIFFTSFLIKGDKRRNLSMHDSFAKWLLVKIIWNGYWGFDFPETCDLGVGNYDVTNRPTVAYQLERACPAPLLLAVWEAWNQNINIFPFSWWILIVLLSLSKHAAHFYIVEMTSFYHFQKQAIEIRTRWRIIGL